MSGLAVAVTSGAPCPACASRQTLSVAGLAELVGAEALVCLPHGHQSRLPLSQAAADDLYALNSPDDLA